MKLTLALLFVSLFIVLQQNIVTKTAEAVTIGNYSTTIGKTGKKEARSP